MCVAENVIYLLLYSIVNNKKVTVSCVWKKKNNIYGNKLTGNIAFCDLYRLDSLLEIFTLFSLNQT